MLYTLILYNVICQLYLNLKKKKKQKFKLVVGLLELTFSWPQYFSLWMTLTSES